MEGTKVCVECGREKPYSVFGPNEMKPQGYFAKCYECRIAAGSGVAKSGRGAPKKLEGNLERLDITCRHPFRLCGDALVLKTFPEFYETHQEPGDGQEWQVCRDCGDAKLVQIFSPGELAVSFRAPIQPRDHLVATASVAHAGVSANGQSAAVAVQEWPKPAPVADLMAELEAAPNALSEDDARMFAEHLSSHTVEELVALHPSNQGEPTSPLLVDDAPAIDFEEPPLEKQLADAIKSLAVAESQRIELSVENIRLKAAMERLQLRMRAYEIDAEIAELEERIEALRAAREGVRWAVDA